MILRLIEAYPEFKALYEDVFELCRNVEGLMEIFSKELLEMDRNTVKLMIDQMQEKIDAQERVIQEKDAELEMVKQEMAQRIAELERKLAER